MYKVKAYLVKWIDASLYRIWMILGADRDGRAMFTQREAKRLFRKLVSWIPRELFFKETVHKHKETVQETVQQVFEGWDAWERKKRK